MPKNCIHTKWMTPKLHSPADCSLHCFLPLLQTVVPKFAQPIPTRLQVPLDFPDLLDYSGLFGTAGWKTGYSAAPPVRLGGGPTPRGP